MVVISFKPGMSNVNMTDHIMNIVYYHIFIFLFGQFVILFWEMMEV